MVKRILADFPVVGLGESVVVADRLRPDFLEARLSIASALPPGLMLS